MSKVSPETGAPGASPPVVYAAIYEKSPMKSAKATAANERDRERRRRQHSSQRVNRRNVWLIVLTALLVIGAAVMFVPPQEKINQGLDLQGGLSVVLTANSTDGGDVSTEDMEKSRAIIESRVNALGASEATVALQGSNQILVQIPGLSDTEAALSTIGRTGQLEFARLDSFTDDSVRSKIDSGGYMSQSYVTDAAGNQLPTGEVTLDMEVEPGTYTTLFTGADITRVSLGKASEASADYAVNVSLNSTAASAFAQATEDLVADHGKIVIILDGVVQSAPAVQSVISDGNVSITGDYTMDEAKSLQTVLESGSLPVSFEYAQSQTVGPTLGQGALQAGVIAALIGLALIVTYLLVFYRGLGVIAAASIAVFAMFYLGLLATLSAFGMFSLSMAGIAGVVLTIGMAADASILTLERFREEIRMGRSVRASADTGVRHGILTSVDANLVSLVSALTLFFLASASVKGFGLTLALGIFCNIVMCFVFMAPLIRLLAPRQIKAHPGFWGVKDSIDAAPHFAADAAAVDPKTVHGRFIKRDINFLGHRKVFWGIAAVTVIAVAVIIGVRGVSFGIEFIGGSSVSFHDTGDITAEQMRDAFDDAGASDASVQTTTTEGQDGYLVRISTTSAEEATQIANAAAATLGIGNDSFEVQTIGPDWGASVIQSSLLAFFASLALIVVYVSIRFRDYKMGLTSIVALLHVLVVVLGVYVLLGREVTPNTIAALLTILGYSLYDTVVAFHRIIETMRSGEVKGTFMTMANHAINQVFIRSVNTSVCAMLPVLCMLILGGDTLKDFALAMFVGLLFGCYSTIAIAAPIYAAWKTREPRNASLVKRYGTAVVRLVFGKLPASAKAASKSKAEPGEGSVAAGTVADAHDADGSDGSDESAAGAASAIGSKPVDAAPATAREASAHGSKPANAPRKGASASAKKKNRKVR